VAEALAGAGPVIARGLGRSYGDPAQCAGGTVLDLGALDAVGEVDPASGEVTVGAGASFHDVLARTLPAGWFLPVTPGTRQVTLGGALAADVHGKNHHRDGSLAAHVVRATLVTPTGVHEIAPGSDPELFWATAGGMGLTGVVTEAVLRMVAVETDRMVVDTERFGELDSVMAAMEAGDAAYRYSVAWVDCMATGRHTGRAVLTRGEHARRADLPSSAPPGGPRAPGPPRLRVPLQAPPGLLNPWTIAAFNEVWYRAAGRHGRGEVLPLAGFFHPLDGVADWNLLYGRRGFVQYQFAVGPDQGDVVRRAVGLLSTGRVPSFLAVLKRFGPGTPGPLSFPVAGWTLALDLPVGPEALPVVLDRLDAMVAEAGGRVYLAKDSRLSPQTFAAMYPRAPEFQEVRRRVDPDGVLASDLSRRLGLDR
jgi:decaprenylphospho-beta-D-ribofuranose 2-oxidase